MPTYKKDKDVFVHGKICNRQTEIIRIASSSILEQATNKALDTIQSILTKKYTQLNSAHSANITLTTPKISTSPITVARFRNTPGYPQNFCTKIGGLHTNIKEFHKQVLGERKLPNLNAEKKLG